MESIVAHSSYIQFDKSKEKNQYLNILHSKRHSHVPQMWTRLKSMYYFTTMQGYVHPYR